MVNEPLLKEALLSLADQCKTQYLVLSTVIDEVSALRETVRGLDPTFADVLDQKRMENASGDIRKVAIQLFDDLAEKLKNVILQ